VATSKKAQGSGGTRRPPARRAAAAPPRKRHWLRWTIVTVLGVVVLGIAVFAIALARTTVPSPNDLTTSEATVVYWADGRTELGRLGDSTRRSIPLSDVPLDVQHAVLAAEDRGFYDHGGVSPVGIVRALWNNVTGGSTQGASTITQQYAKNAFLTQERTWDRKIREILLATKLETVVSKDEILENYLNTIYFGRGADGIEAASIAYFGVPTSELSVEQGAVLAAIIKSPSGLAPEKDLAGLKARWSYVMDAMVEQGWLTPAQRAKAEFPKIKKLKAKDRLGGQTGFLLSMVEQQLLDQGFDETEIQRGGLRVTSTFDQAAQKAATAAVRKAGPDSGTAGLRIGLAAVRPGTGEVVAIYGGPDFVTDQINNATREFAQAGSTFKPFALAAATEKGIGLSTVWPGNSPATVDGYTFNNYGNRSYGDVTLLKATEDSINSAYVSLESEIGVDTVADAAIRAGVPSDTPGLDDRNLTLVLGTSSPSALSMADAYATFAARGDRVSPTTVTRVVGPNGGLLYDYAPRATSAFDPDTVDTVTYALGKVVTDGTGFAAQALGRPAAAKTGTTDDNKSAWFVGYTPQLAVAVLMAKENSDGIPVSMAGTGGLETVTGGSFPAAIWTTFMKSALDGLPALDFPAPPPGVITPSNCPASIAAEGDPVPEGCPTPPVVPEFSNAPEPSAVATLPPSPVPSEVPSETAPPDPQPSASDPQFGPSSQPQPGEPTQEGVTP
jgi:membrane peptidoglycan carboxypeptidase